MQSHNNAVAESAWLYRILTLGPDRIVLAGETLRVEYVDSLTEIHVGDIDAIVVGPSWFWSRLTIHLADGTERSIGGLDGLEAARVRDAALAESERVRRAALAEAARAHEAAVAEAARRAKELSLQLTRLDERLSQLFSGKQYVRHGKSKHVPDALSATLRQCGELVKSTSNGVRKRRCTGLLPSNP